MMSGNTVKHPTTDLYEVSLFAQKLLDQEVVKGESLPDDRLVYNLLSLNTPIRSYNSKIDGKAWIQALHVIFAILTLGIFLLKNHLYISELKVELRGTRSKATYPLSFYTQIDPASREKLLDDVPGYDGFKTAFGDKAPLVLERFAAIERDFREGELFTLEKLLAEDLNKIKGTIFLKSLAEIGETPLSEIKTWMEWSLLISLGKEKLVAKPREASDPPRVADLPTLTEAEFLDAFSNELNKYNSAFLHPERSIWDLFSFETLKGLSATNFTEIVKNHSLFSAEALPDIDHFKELSHEQQELWLSHVVISPDLLEFLFPYNEFSYKVLISYKESAWVAFLKAPGRFAKLTKQELNDVVRRALDRDLPICFATALTKNEIVQLDPALLKDRKFLENLLLSKIEVEKIQAFLVNVPITQFTAISLMIRKLR